MPKRYNTPHRSRVVKTRLSEEEYADFTARLAPNLMPENVLSAELVNIADTYGNIALWISVASGALMLIALCFYTLDKKKHAEIVAALEAESVNAESIENEKGKKKLMEADSVADILRESRAENEASSDLQQPSDADDRNDLKF